MPEPGRVLTRQEVAAMTSKAEERMEKSSWLPEASVLALARSHEQLREALAKCVGYGMAYFDDPNSIGEGLLIEALDEGSDALSAGEETP